MRSYTPYVYSHILDIELIYRSYLLVYVLEQYQHTKFAPYVADFELNTPSSPEANVGVLALMFALAMLASVAALVRQQEVR